MPLVRCGVEIGNAGESEISGARPCAVRLVIGLHPRSLVTSCQPTGQRTALLGAKVGDRRDVGPGRAGHAADTGDGQQAGLALHPDCDLAPDFVRSYVRRRDV
jgi:hypothetical protein